MNKTVTADRLGPITAPGFAATIMAPDNNAMNNLFDKLGELSCSSSCCSDERCHDDAAVILVVAS
jgi:hypothetical protein